MAEIKNHFGIGLKYYDKGEVVAILKKYFRNVESFEDETVLSFENPLEALRHIQKTGTTIKGHTSVSKIKSYKEKTLTYRTGYFRATNQ